MSNQVVLDRFIEKNPLTVMTRAIMGAVLTDELDEIFEQNRDLQYDDTIQFSTLAISIAEIALGTVKNRNQAYRKYQQQLNVAKSAYYAKVNRSEPQIAENVVSFSAQKCLGLIEELGVPKEQVLPGYRVMALDGNHMQKTEKRLKETRGLCAAALPGTVVARLDLQTRLFDRAYLLENAHAQESTVLDEVLEDLGRGDLVVADRHFCIQHFLVKLASQSGSFIIRQHGRLKGELLGERRYVGRTDSGEVYEQNLKIQDGNQTLTVRRVTVILDSPTRDGDQEIHILSNVPSKDASACRIAEIYRQRWEIENSFYYLTTTLTCEMKSNCYPRCALLLFCMAMVASNCRQVLFAALYAEHDEESVDSMSQYQMALDIVDPMEGMLTAISSQEWSVLVSDSQKELSFFLRRVSRHVNVKSYKKSQRGPKKPKPKRKRCKAGTHLSTAKLLAERNER